MKQRPVSLARPRSVASSISTCTQCSVRRSVGKWRAYIITGRAGPGPAGLQQCSIAVRSPTRLDAAAIYLTRWSLLRPNMTSQRRGGQRRQKTACRRRRRVAIGSADAAASEDIARQFGRCWWRDCVCREIVHKGRSHKFAQNWPPSPLFDVVCIVPYSVPPLAQLRRSVVKSDGVKVSQGQSAIKPEADRYSFSFSVPKKDYFVILLPRLLIASQCERGEKR